MNPKVHESKKSSQAHQNLENVVSIFYRSILFLLGAVLLVTLSSACSPNERHLVVKENSPEKKPTGKVDGGGTSTDAADTLADEGEALLEGVKLNDAFGKFNEALKINPENHRAIFWRASLRPILDLKGIARRMGPLYMQATGNSGRYQAMQNQLRKSNSTALDTFFNDGPEDIKTPEELQEWMDRFRNSIVSFRHELRAIRDAELSIAVPSFLYTGKSSEMECRSVSFGPVRFDGLEGNCGKSSGNTIGVNRADLEAILATAGVYQAYLELWTAYRINPMALTNGNQKPITSRESAQDAVKALLNVNRGGELRQAKPFSGIRDLTTEMITGLKFIQEHQQELCSHGYSTPENRKGYLIAAGLCIEYSSGEDKNEATRTLRSFEAFLTGRPLDIVIDGTTAKFNAMEMFEHPPKDLKDLAPFKFDNCGTLIELNGKALDPYFPGSDVNSLLALNTRNSRERCRQKEHGQ